MDRKVPYIRIAFYFMAALSCASCGAPPPSGPKILETGYFLLDDIGREEPGYGLYSYALVVNHSDRSAKFLSEVFSAIPPVEGLATQHSQINLLSIPLKKDKAEELRDILDANESYLVDSSAAFAQDFYDYKLARTVLDHICDPPAEGVKVVCEGDLSRGPYIFTYAQPASEISPVPPPFLFMDLSDVHERAFPEIIAAFKAQVKREDISDRAKIDTLRLRLLSIVLTAADWIGPVQKAMAEIVHTVSGRTEGDKK
jgi:hypothetical protein